MKNKLILLFLLLAVCLFNFIGCAPEPYIQAPPQTFGVPGIYHKVEKGQTLWRISKIYNIELDELVRINKIPDATNIEINQMIFIPNREKELPIPIQSDNDDFIWPINGKIISTFGSTYHNLINKGINIEPDDKLDVVAAKSGKVVFEAENFGNYGKTVIIDHGDGFSTVYARCAKVLVKAGDSIQRGALIAKAGLAGRDRRTYLHFEIRKGALAQNPLFYLPR